MCTTLLGLLLVAAAVPGTGIRSAQSLSYGWQYESGVLNRGLVTIDAGFPVADRVGLDAAAGFSMFQHQGLAAWGIGARFSLVERYAVFARLAYQHEQWNDWQAGENRVVGTFQARPLAPLEVELGLAWRVPLFNPESYWSPLVWSGALSELNVVYRIDWRFLEGPGWDLSLGSASFDGLHLRNLQHFGFTVSGHHRLDDSWQLSGRFGTALKGLSGLLLSARDFSGTLGVTHDF